MVVVRGLRQTSEGSVSVRESVDVPVKRLYAGLVPCLLRASPANAGMLYTVDKIKQMLG